MIKGLKKMMKLWEQWNTVQLIHAVIKEDGTLQTTEVRVNG